eukprot:3777374-Pleurochrysis_carterae.AAC.1
MNRSRAHRRSAALSPTSCDSALEKLGLCICPSATCAYALVFCRTTKPVSPPFYEKARCCCTQQLITARPLQVAAHEGSTVHPKSTYNVLMYLVPADGRNSLTAHYSSHANKCAYSGIRAPRSVVAKLQESAARRVTFVKRAALERNLKHTSFAKLASPSSPHPPVQEQHQNRQTGTFAINALRSLHSNSGNGSFQYTDHLMHAPRVILTIICAAPHAHQTSTTVTLAAVVTESCGCACVLVSAASYELATPSIGLPPDARLPYFCLPRGRQRWQFSLSAAPAESQLHLLLKRLEILGPRQPCTRSEPDVSSGISLSKPPSGRPSWEAGGGLWLPPPAARERPWRVWGPEGALELQPALAHRRAHDAALWRAGAIELDEEAPDLAEVSGRLSEIEGGGSE